MTHVKPSARAFASLPAATQAGILGNTPDFQTFTAERLGFPKDTRATPTGTAEYIRRTCNVHSRKQLNTDPAAKSKFAALRTEFDAWRGKIPEQRT